MALLALALCALPATSFADGDPGSDVLLDQNLFFGSDANLSLAQQLQLGQLLSATQRAGAPVRVAIISHQDDLGTVTTLWQRPRTYAEYLGYELSLAYSGRLLIVMPNGYGVYWHANPAGGAKLEAQLAGKHPSADTPGALAAGTVAAVDQIERDAGVSASTLRHDSAPASTTGVGAAQTVAPATGPAPAVVNSGASSGSGSGSLGAVVAILVILGLTGYIAVRSGVLRGRRVRVGPIAIVPVALLAVVVLALLVNQTGSPAPSQGDTLATNPHLDPGTQVAPTPAPKFTLIDESGHRVSLSQYRGKVVLLSFVDDECQTICPLTTQAMLDAKAALGKAGQDVQLLGVDANWKSTQVEDVLNYTEVHGLLGRWHFLTSTSLAQLERVWTAYHVNEKVLEQAGNNDIEHIAATYVIDAQGRIRDLFTTYPSYASIGQLGERMAQDAAALLPGHPRVGRHYSFAEIRGISPNYAATAPRLGGGRIRVGRGRARLYLFFATWDKTLGIGPQLDILNRYVRDARAQHLPPLTAIDEGSVEPSPQALPAFIRSLSSPLAYPIGIDTNGRLADGYQVQGEPWFVLTNAAGNIVWYQEVYTDGWPSVSSLISQIRAAMKPSPHGLESVTSAKLALAGSPKPLAALHAQSSQLLRGGQAALDARIRSLHGYPIVLNIWGSWCGPCQAEFGLFSRASALYGKRVAFLGADTDDEPADARAFLSSHPVSYPSYSTTDTSIEKLLNGGLEGTPTTVFIGANGRIVSVHIGQYTAQGTLDQDIQDAALGS